MRKEYHQFVWSPQVEEDCRRLVRLAVAEDLDRGHDWTTLALAPEDATAAAHVVVRKQGIICGLEAARTTLHEMSVQAEWHPLAKDGDELKVGDQAARVTGSARDLLTAERILLNFIGRLSGVATLTRQYVEAIAGTSARIYDTRKTTPGWRRLEKYAVRCGGGNNHRSGLYDGILIKDNHLALGRQRKQHRSPRFKPADAVLRARQFLAEHFADDPRQAAMIVEVEVDTLIQLDAVLPTAPDIILLDNMKLKQLREAVFRRNMSSVSTELEASGGVNLETVRAIAETGVERISVGALTHSAVCLDVALDWEI
ncbi:MAG: carboxylating nicotinate-nucleotide diphosphorylase [Pirellulaceae bacterium]|nr:carboxylating nicotinate-nucleotide diphosphorylase [Pirellulaceae bacterium]